MAEYAGYEQEMRAKEPKSRTAHERWFLTVADFGPYMGKQKAHGYDAWSIEALMLRLRPVMLANGLVLEWRIVGGTGDVSFRDKGQGKGDWYSSAVYEVSAVNINKPDDRVVWHQQAMGLDSSDKGPGKQLAYALKYAIARGLMIQADDEPECVPHARSAQPSPRLSDAMNGERVPSVTAKSRAFDLICQQHRLDRKSPDTMKAAKAVFDQIVSDNDLAPGDYEAVVAILESATQGETAP